LQLVGTAWSSQNCGGLTFRQHAAPGGLSEYAVHRQTAGKN
jgi:hypothetical protein